MTNKKLTGFTLIELMISISILSMLLIVGTYSYALMSERWNKELGSFSESDKQAKHLQILQDALEGVFSHVVIDKKKTPSLFFIGGQSSLLSVTHHGIFTNDFPEVFRVSKIEKENGLVDLVYQAISTNKLFLVGTEQEIEFEKSIVLFKNLDDVIFEYYGWENIFTKSESDNSGLTQQWFTQYSGIDRQLLPEKLVIKLTKAEQNVLIIIYLNNNSGRWLSPYMGDSSD